MEVVHDGWLVKSPPEKRILKAKWRQRWFVLRHSGLLPGQFILEYFTDNTCKKLKGKIDLDQCEQVDAGLTFEGKKTNYQFMFDIRTPKRIYYLVAQTESDMNKWVDCICSVCGLKIHIEEDFLTPQESTSNSVVTNRPSSSNAVSASNSTETKSSSNPYIPISECITGKPVLTDVVPLGTNCNDMPAEIAPPLPVSEWERQKQSLSGEFYDYPRPVQTVVGDASTSNCVNKSLSSLKHSVSDVTHAYNNLPIGSSAWHTLPPRVNWETHPKDVNSGTVPRRCSVEKNDSAAYDVVPPPLAVNRDIETVRKEAQNLADQFEKSVIESNVEANISSENHLNGNIIKAPPRPPKPSKLKDRHEYENLELVSAPVAKPEKSVYDVPPSPKEVPIDQLPPQVIAETKNQNSDISPSTKVPLSLSTGNETVSVDDTYDFPKFRSEDNINATVPRPQLTGTAQRQRRHAYTNAPPGLFNSKELIFNYEYRPSLMSDGYVNTDKQDSCTTGDSATTHSPVYGPYVNLPTSPNPFGVFQGDIPPTVNRGLKPKKNSISDDKAVGISFLTLQPPPVCRSRGKPDKRSFTKQRAAPSPTGMNGTPPVPNRFRHHLDVSTTSEDDLSSSGGSRRNSSNDEQARHLFYSAPVKKDEIQYLDLDLDSEPSPSPKSPERLTASTVYKKVDFIKTKAFNEMRVNVEETYRKSQ